MTHRAVRLGLVVLIVGSQASAETAQEILTRRHSLENGVRRWTDRHEKMRVKLIGEGRDANRVLELDVYEKRFTDGRSAMVAFLREPSDVRGMAFLGLREVGREPQSWLYLPGPRHTRRIRRPGDESFVGSDLTYGDLDLLREMPRWSESDASARLLREEVMDGAKSYVLALVPRTGNAGYSEIVVWLGEGDLIARQIELHAAGVGLRKRIRQSEIREILGIPVPGRIEVEAAGGGARTEIAMGEVHLNEGLDDGLFTQAALERGAP